MMRILYSHILINNPLARGIRFLFILFILTSFHTRSYSSGISLSEIYSDNMVIQSGKPFILKGKAAPLEEVRVRILQITEKSIADQNGNWEVRFDPLEIAASFNIAIETDTDKKTIHNVIAGEVWLCSGQSNMALQAANTDVIKKIHYADADHIRYFLALNDPSETKENYLKGHWIICTAENIGQCSAVALSFAWFLNHSLHKTIGLIVNARGGTPVESWTELDMLKSKKYDTHIFQQRKQWQKDRNVYEKQYNDKIKNWQIAAKKAKENGMPLPPRIWPPFQLRKDWDPGSLYNALIFPMHDFTFKGVIWYQGESNADYPFVYRNQLADMINCWRDLFKNKQLPFYIIQLPEYATTDDWPVIRESQASVGYLGHIGLVVTLGLGDSSNIHPVQKAEVGRRVALQALKNEYNFSNMIAIGPVLYEMKTNGNKIRLTFDCSGSAIRSLDGQAIRNMEIAGSDFRFLQAEVRIDGNSLIIWNDKIEHPQNVRYAWKNVPEKINFVNNESLPAPPFFAGQLKEHIAREKQQAKEIMVP